MPMQIFPFLHLDTISKSYSQKVLFFCLTQCHPLFIFTVHKQVPDLHITSFTCSGVLSYKVSCMAM